jgi:hypothetical protein
MPRRKTLESPDETIERILAIPDGMAIITKWQETGGSLDDLVVESQHHQDKPRPAARITPTAAVRTATPRRRRTTS